MVLILSIVLALFISWPWNLVVVLCGAIAEVGEVVWGRRLARRWRPKSGPETIAIQPDPSLKTRAQWRQAAAASGPGYMVRYTFPAYRTSRREYGRRKRISRPFASPH
jgi:hypothetical protein